MERDGFHESARTSFGSAKLGNGNVFVAGGVYGTSQILTGTEEYSPTTGTWTTRAPMHTQRSNFSLAYLGGINRVLAVAGWSVSGPMTDAELYTP